MYRYNSKYPNSKTECCTESLHSRFQFHFDFIVREEEEVALAEVQLGVVGGHQAVLGQQLGQGHLHLHHGEALSDAQARATCKVK